MITLTAPAIRSTNSYSAMPAAATGTSRYSTAQVQSPTNINIGGPILFSPSASYFNPSASLNTHFGSCMCPICASQMLLMDRYSKLKASQVGTAFQPGETLNAIAQKTGFNSIPHERATRLTAPAKADLDALSKAALDIELLGDGRARLNPPKAGSLYAVVNQAMRTMGKLPEKLAPHDNQIAFSPAESNDFFKRLDNPHADGFSTFAAIHHMQNDDHSVTAPLMLGYALTGKPNMVEKELPVFSIRSLPTFENMDSPAASLSNIIGHTALDDKKRFDTVAVVVEKNQTDLHRYVDFLEKLGVGVKRYSTTGNKAGGNTLAMPLAYESKLQQLYPENGIEVFQIDVKTVRDWMNKGIPAAVSQQVDVVHKDLAPALKETREAFAKNKSHSNAWDLLITMLSCPPAAGARRQIPRED